MSSYQHRPAEELYDLREDPHELHNLAGKAGYHSVKKKLKKELVEWMKQQNDPGVQYIQKS